MKRTLYFLVLAFLGTSCNFLNSTSEGYENAINQINAIANGEDKEAITYFDFDESDTVKANQLIEGVPRIQNAIVQNFGTDFDLSFAESEKKFSFEFSTDESSTEFEPLKIKIQIKSETHFGYIEATINEQNSKIQYLNLLDYKKEIPSYYLLYLAGLFALLVIAANIMAIARIRKSQLNKKWLRIIGVLLFNVPTITLTALGHLSLDISFQILLGVAFSATGIAGTFVSFGIPIGAIVALIKVKKADINKG